MPIHHNRVNGKRFYMFFRPLQVVISIIVCLQVNFTVILNILSTVNSIFLINFIG